MSALGSLADPEEIYRHTLQVALGLRLLGATGLIWLAALLIRYFRRNNSTGRAKEPKPRFF
jgi:hypothetical protein